MCSDALGFCVCVNILVRMNWKNNVTAGGDRMDPMKDEEMAVMVIAIEARLLKNLVTEVMVEDIRMKTGTETGAAVEVAVGVNTRTVPTVTVVAEEDIVDTVALAGVNGTDEVMRDVGIGKVVGPVLNVGHRCCSFWVGER